MTASLLRIGELARRAGVSHRTIHYYERIGLLAPAQREGAGYRYYDEQALERLEKIAALKNIGLSLQEIGQVIELYFSDPTGLKGKQEVLKILQGQLLNTRSKLDELGRFEDDLQSNIERMEKLIAIARKKYR